MPVAFSLAAPGSALVGLAGSPPIASSLPQIPQIRKEFPENWIFYDAEKYDGFLTFSLGLFTVYSVLWYLYASLLTL